MLKSQLTYAVGDIHGRADLLAVLLDRIDAHAAGEPYRLVFLGDYIDRGPDSAGVLRLVRQRWEAQPGRVVCLKGNHEEMLVQACTPDAAADAGAIWIANGGGATLASFSVDDPAHISPDIVDWLAGLPTSWQDGQRIYVHAGLDPDTPLNRQSDIDRLWIRDAFLDREHDFGRHVVHGHTPLLHGHSGEGAPKSRLVAPDERRFRTNIDTGAVFGGTLTAGVFDDRFAHASAFIQVQDDGTPRISVGKWHLSNLQTGSAVVQTRSRRWVRPAVAAGLAAVAAGAIATVGFVRDDAPGGPVAKIPDSTVAAALRSAPLQPSPAPHADAPSAATPPASSGSETAGAQTAPPEDPVTATASVGDAGVDRPALNLPPQVPDARVAAETAENILRSLPLPEPEPPAVARELVADPALVIAGLTAGIPDVPEPRLPTVDTTLAAASPAASDPPATSDATHLASLDEVVLGLPLPRPVPDVLPPELMPDPFRIVARLTAGIPDVPVPHVEPPVDVMAAVAAQTRTIPQASVTFTAADLAEKARPGRTRALASARSREPRARVVARDRKRRNGDVRVAVSAPEKPASVPDPICRDGQPPRGFEPGVGFVCVRGPVAGGRPNAAPARETGDGWSWPFQVGVRSVSGSAADPAAAGAAASTPSGTGTAGGAAAGATGAAGAAASGSGSAAGSGGVAGGGTGGGGVGGALGGALGGVGNAVGSVGGAVGGALGGLGEAVGGAVGGGGASGNGASAEGNGGGSGH